jgi:hypothetical protein
VFGPACPYLRLNSSHRCSRVLIRSSGVPLSSQTGGRGEGGIPCREWLSARPGWGLARIE